jgi:TspO/MBR family
MRRASEAEIDTPPLACWASRADSDHDQLPSARASLFYERRLRGRADGVPGATARPGARGRRGEQHRPLFVLFGTNLALNLAWTLIFFRGRSPLAAGVKIVALEGTTVALVVRAWPLSRLVAAFLLVPYAIDRVCDRADLGDLGAELAPSAAARSSPGRRPSDAATACRCSTVSHGPNRTASGLRRSVLAAVTGVLCLVVASPAVAHQPHVVGDAARASRRAARVTALGQNRPRWRCDAERVLVRPE